MRYLLALAIVMSGCGTHDYKTKPADAEEKKTENQTPATASGKKTTGSQRSGVPTLFERTAKEGPFWEWTQGNPTAEHLKCTLRDGTEVNYLQALGYQVFGGLILGLIYKNAGAYYIGRPVPPTSDRERAIPVGPPNVSGWAWERIYMDGERFKQGATRGIVLTTLCAHALGPGVFFLTDGLLGRDFNSLATAIALGIMGTGATQPYLNYFARGGFGDPIGDIDQNNSRTAYALRTLSSKISFGGKKNLTGRAILPNLTAISIGGAIGYFVYHRLHRATSVDDEKVECKPETLAADPPKDQR